MQNFLIYNKPPPSNKPPSRVLAEQLKFLNTGEINPFVANNEDIDACAPDTRYPDNILIDADHDSDEHIEID